MEKFYYSSSSTHGIVTPQGKRMKTTNIDVENGRGVLRMSIEDDKGVHSDTRELTEREVKNIKKHKFMPNLFSSAITNIKKSREKKNSRKSAAKNSTKKHRSSKQGNFKQK